MRTPLQVSLVRKPAREGRGSKSQVLSAAAWRRPHRWLSRVPLDAGQGSPTRQPPPGLRRASSSEGFSSKTVHVDETVSQEAIGFNLLDDKLPEISKPGVWHPSCRESQ